MKEENPKQIKIELKNSNKFLMLKKINLIKLNNNSLEETVISEIFKRLYKIKDVRACSTNKESEIYNQNLNLKFNKLVKITKITCLYKEKVNLQFNKFKDLKLKWKKKGDKLWHKSNS